MHTIETGPVDIFNILHFREDVKDLDGEGIRFILQGCLLLFSAVLLQMGLPTHPSTLLLCFA